MNFYQMSVDDVLVALKSDKNGLSLKEAQLRLKVYGKNKFVEPKRDTLLAVFVRQFESPLIYVLLVAAALIYVAGEHTDAFLISGILFFNAILGTIQEGRAQSIFESLRKYVTAQAVVLRDNNKHIISDELVVPGDILLLQAGEKIPADCRIIQAQSLLIDESMLTGESIAIAKSEDVIKSVVPIHDQKNMLFQATYVLNGFAQAIVVATGVHTEIGKLQKEVEQIQSELPLKKEIDFLSRGILVFIFFLCFLMLVFGLAIGKSFKELLVMLTALFICVIPEGLPLVFTIALVTGAYRMVRNNMLVKQLQAVEGLGLTDVILIDKTGTLTRNEMMVSAVYATNQIFTVSGQGYKPEGALHDSQEKKVVTDPLFTYLCDAAGLLSADAVLEFRPQEGRYIIQGDPTPAALQVFAVKFGATKEVLKEKYQELLEIPFESQTRIQAGLYRSSGKIILFIAGAPEIVIKYCKQDKKNEMVLEQLLSEGLRVVAFGMREISEEDKDEIISKPENLLRYTNNCTFLGFLGIQDAIRSDVREIIERSQQAGLRIVMVTGDHLETALYVAKKVGIYTEQTISITGNEFTQLSQQQLLEKLPKITVFARVTPDQKLKIVQWYKQLGKIVAMTGDGVNDAPSLIAADLGIAMGIIGTDVAKKAADLILLDDSFKSIIKAIEEGRHIFYTLQRVTLYFFATNFGEILIVAFSLVLRLPLPFFPAQILWLNLITDGFLDVALSTEPKEHDLLVRIKDRHIITIPLIVKFIYMAIPMAIGSVAVFYYYQQQSLALARTMTLVTMAFFQWFNAWNCRSFSLSMFQIGFFANKWLLIAMVLVLGLQFLAVYAPFMQHIFKTVPLSFEQWVVAFIVSSSILILEEMRKVWIRRYY